METCRRQCLLNMQTAMVVLHVRVKGVPRAPHSHKTAAFVVFHIHPYYCSRCRHKTFPHAILRNPGVTPPPPRPHRVFFPALFDRRNQLLINDECGAAVEVSDGLKRQECEGWTRCLPLSYDRVVCPSVCFVVLSIGRLLRRTIVELCTACH